MPVTMVQIGVVRVLMGHWLVPMPMRMRLAYSPLMRVLVMIVMRVRVIMF
jgi:hypothetical protein